MHDGARGARDPESGLRLRSSIGRLDAGGSRKALRVDCPTRAIRWVSAHAAAPSLIAAAT